MNNVHGVAVDVADEPRLRERSSQPSRSDLRRERKVSVASGRLPSGRPAFTSFRSVPTAPSSTFDRNTHKMLKYDLDGRLIYSWGTVGDFPGTLWGVHGISTDQEGNLYVAEVDAGRFQKFRPRPGANPAYLVGKPIYSAWQ